MRRKKKELISSVDVLLLHSVTSVDKSINLAKYQYNNIGMYSNTYTKQPCRTDKKKEVKGKMIVKGNLKSELN